MTNIKKLFAILGKWKPYYALSGLLLILSTIFRMFEPKVLQVAIDGVIAFFQKGGGVVPEAKDAIAQTIYNILPDLNTSTVTSVLLVLGAIYLSISLIRGIAMFTSSSISAYCTEKATKRLRDNLFAHIQGLPMKFHSKVSTGEMIQRCTGDVDTVRKFIGSQVVDVILLFAVFFTSFAMMLSMHVTYALIAVSIVPLIFFLSFFFFKKESEIWKKHEAEQDKLTSIVEENLAGIRVVTAFAKQDFEIEKFEKQNQEKLKIGIKHLNLHALYWPISDFLFHAQITLSLLAGGFFTLNGAITVGELIAFYSYIVMVSWPMRRIGRVMSQMSMALVAIERLSTILDDDKEDYSGTYEEDKSLLGDIEFKNVWFKYKDDEEHVLKDVSFKVTAGDQVALLGPTGAGKSTIIALLARFYEPEKGQILIDGIDSKTYSKAYLRDKIGVVLQKPFLFSTTIKNNIKYAKPTATEEEIVAAAKAASIDHIMHVFADGYDTVVGEKGVTLSGGQKQRVALARTLLENPDVLVLDDATSAVDTETEYDIQQALQRYLNGKTTFVIAHRMTSIQYANNIIVLEDGSVAQHGKHEDLVKEEGFYQQVYKVQSAIESDILS